ncbi:MULTISPECIES: rhodanese-like domain-containing protein [unclassified Agarivorans]|uniref:rhodanese-like domain-containing protein n=1 Tax=unclassified Agarivorans TaxID=2636026 RepID=UPI003D7DF202
MNKTKIVAILLLLSSSVVSFTSLATERAEQAWQYITDKQALLIDVRSPHEFQQGHLNGAQNMPHQTVAAHIEQLTTDRNQAIVVYCRSGNRANYALQVLQQMGYQQVVNGGGLQEMLAEKP